MSPTIAERLLEQLDQLPPESQRMVLDFAQVLASSCPKGTPGKRLLRFTGVIKADDIRSMKGAIEAGCEQVDVNEW